MSTGWSQDSGTSESWPSWEQRDREGLLQQKLDSLPTCLGPKPGMVEAIPSIASGFVSWQVRHMGLV